MTTRESTTARPSRRAPHDTGTSASYPHDPYTH
ncbi:hypothetical protein QFZ74_002135 [Streptomyces sp. V3I7]|nr:hypothetical protein [Streptomyces sp. V3I7]